MASSSQLRRSSPGEDARADIVCDVVEQVRALQQKHEETLMDMREKHRLAVEDLKRRIELQSSPKWSSGESDADQKEKALLHLDVDFTDQKAEFIEFAKGVEKGKGSKEYKAVHKYLVKCFTDADNNFDGRLGFMEFEVLIEKAAALPRRFGYAPATPEMYKTEWDRLRMRLALFKSLCTQETSSGRTEDSHISLDTWLRYATAHIKEKVKNLSEMDSFCRMSRSKDDFREFILAACQSRQTREYKELYLFLLKCFTEADGDLDGRIDAQSFHSLIDRAAEAPTLFGFAPPASVIYSTEAQKNQARQDLFESLDSGKTGYIDFDTWLQYIYTHICEKSALFGESGKVPEVLAATASTGNSVCPIIS